ncbi:putative heme d1 biosynthesis radical SAM protein NirJ2 [Halonatronum saccharophilum]|uniref:putative heme d1 biosynthesis radical SAM protein NirJ2 n=1 Tax=Halonatronum saccharophilum TaxID=150060 RepID=UPI0004836898|nr:putative heme d1 biosynthesis radical SAM protein NirJ2 [Halonatronum saccharophilum]
MIISWNTTKRCNLYCEHCYRDSGPETSSDELSTEEAKKLLEEIAKAGFKIMIFSGGEPLLRDDIYELITHAKNLKMRPVMGTNGTMIDLEVAKRLKEAGLARVGISLDSIDSCSHDDFRGEEGAWQKTIEGIRNCHSVSLDTQINTTITDRNYEELEKITDLAVQLGSKAHHPFFLVPTGRGRDIEKESLRSKRYRKMINRILDKQAEVDIELKPTCAPQFMPMAKEQGVYMRFSRGCIAGIAYCCILPDGDVHICPYLPVKVGNVLENPLDQIWESSKVFNELRAMEYGGNCGRCKNIEICGGCRARAYYYSDGDYLAEEPWCSSFN